MVYTVGMLAREIGVGIQTIHRWEKQGIIPKARRLNHRRVYSEQEVRKIREMLEIPNSEDK